MTPPHNTPPQPSPREQHLYEEALRYLHKLCARDLLMLCNLHMQVTMQRMTGQPMNAPAKSSQARPSLHADAYQDLEDEQLRHDPVSAQLAREVIAKASGKSL